MSTDSNNKTKGIKLVKKKEQTPAPTIEQKVLLVSKQKRYWLPCKPVAVDDSIVFDNNEITTKTTIFRCIGISVGATIQCSWMDGEEGFFNNCTVTNLFENNLTVAYEDGEISTCSYEYLRFPHKSIDSISVDVNSHLGAVFPQAKSLYEQQVNAKIKEDEERKRQEEREAEEKRKFLEERKKSLLASQQPAPIATQKITVPSKRIPAALLAFFMGGLGAHKFYLGYTSAGVIQIFLNLMCVGAFVAMAEAIIYLSMSDEDFINTYQTNTKNWF